MKGKPTMKIAHVLMAGAVIALMSSTAPVRAADAPAAAPKGAPNFAEHKAKMVEKMQSKLDCVKAANDKEAMGKCFPRWKERGEQMKERHGGMMKDGAPPGDGPPQ